MTERALKTISDIQKGTADFAARSIVPRLSAEAMQGLEVDAVLHEAAAAASSLILAISASNVQRLAAHIRTESGHSEDGARIAQMVLGECTEVVFETIRLLPACLEHHGVVHECAAFIAEVAETRVGSLVRERLAGLQHQVPCSAEELCDSDSDFFARHVPC